MSELTTFQARETTISTSKFSIEKGSRGTFGNLICPSWNEGTLVNIKPIRIKILFILKQIIISCDIQGVPHHIMILDH